MGDFPELCKILHETTPLMSYGTIWDSRRAYLSFLLKGQVGCTSCWLVDDERDWLTMVSGGLDLILHCWSAGTNCARVSGRGLL